MLLVIMEYSKIINLSVSKKFLRKGVAIADCSLVTISHQRLLKNRLGGNVFTGEINTNGERYYLEKTSIVNRFTSKELNTSYAVKGCIDN